jgi:transketolase
VDNKKIYNETEMVALAHDLRLKTFEAFIVNGEAHLGGSFSMIEGLLSVMSIMNFDNDTFVLSKAHASFPYCIYLQDLGYNVPIKTHLERIEGTPIKTTTGSLGHGLPIAAGIAAGMKRQSKNGKVFVMISDGECQEGTTWETLLIANAHKLNNLIVLVDNNKIQALDFVDDTLPLGDLAKKFDSFEWKCTEVQNGHCFKEIMNAIDISMLSDKPSCIILNTITGKGVPEFENDPVWHAKKIKENEKIIGRNALEAE